MSEKTQQALPASSLDAIFRPRSVAVIGASTRQGAIGRVIFEKLLNADFNGPVFPVHPTAKFVRSVKAYPNIKSIPWPVDLAVIAVKREMVLQVVQDCAEAGVKGLVMITAGFREIGQQGLQLEEKILEVVRHANMRMVGPNCMGVICTDSQIRLDATFAPTVPRPGNIGFVSQSGALGVTILEYAASLNLGVSMFISIGNKADIAGNEVLRYWHHDPSVEVILMYLESFGRPQQFVRLARQISREKPIVIVKSGRTRSGARAATSHTGALAGTDLIFDSIFQQCGITRADTIEEMFDFAMGFANQPLPGGNNVAIITNAGGPAILAADACENLGLNLPMLSFETQKKIRRKVSPDASLANPVDLLASATEEEFKYALQCVLAEKQIDAAIIIFVPPVITDPINVAKSISEAIIGTHKPIMGCFMGVKGIAKGVEELQKHGIPAYAFPESAAKTLRVMHDYALWRQRKEKPIRQFKVDRAAAQRILQQVKQQNADRLTDWQAFQVLQNYGIPVARTVVCSNWQDIVSAARQIGFPVVLKISSDKIIHKTEVKAVKPGLLSEKALEDAFADLENIVQSSGLQSGEYQYLIQEMVSGGREVMFGAKDKPKFGPMVAFGLGGILVEVFKDIALRIAPLTEDMADEMIESIKGISILRGVRGAEPVSMPTLREMLLRISQLVIDFPQIAELDINPFMAFPTPEKCKAVDVRIHLHET